MKFVEVSGEKSSLAERVQEEVCVGILTGGLLLS